MERVNDAIGSRATRSRRGYLAALGTALLAGCTGPSTTDGGDTPPGSETPPADTGTDATSASATETASRTETDSPTATPSVTVDRGRTYRETADGPLALDVIHPRGVERAPAVVFAHGGGWAYGSRGQFEPHARALADAGYASLLVTYRLSGTASYPEPVEDLAAALAWARDNADDLALDPDRVAVGGGSAGGHLAALVATAPDAFAPDGSLAPPAALAGFNGVYDVTTPAMRSADLVEQFMGTAYAEATADYRAASPVERVDGADPPALLLHGTNDKVVPYQQAVDFRDALSGAGVDVSLYTAEDAGHGFHNDDPWLSRTTDRLVDFLVAHL